MNIRKQIREALAKQIVDSMYVWPNNQIYFQEGTDPWIVDILHLIEEDVIYEVGSADPYIIKEFLFAADIIASLSIGSSTEDFTKVLSDKIPNYMVEVGSYPELVRWATSHDDRTSDVKDEIDTVFHQQKYIVGPNSSPTVADLIKEAYQREVKKVATSLWDKLGEELQKVEHKK